MRSRSIIPIVVPTPPAIKMRANGLKPVETGCNSERVTVHLSGLNSGSPRFSGCNRAEVPAFGTSRFARLQRALHQDLRAIVVEY